MAKLWTIKAGEAQKDVVYAAAAADLLTVDTDEIAICIDAGVGANQVQVMGLIDQCREALREAGPPLPATGLALAVIADGGARKDVTVTLTGGGTAITANTVLIAYGTAFPRAAADGASLLFDEAIEEIKKAIAAHLIAL